MTRIPSPRESSSPAARVGGALTTAAAVGLIACAAARCFVAEVPYRTSAVRGAAVSAEGAEPAARPDVDLSELSRVTFATLLAALVATWAIGAALRGSVELRHTWLGIGGVLFAAIALASALAAADRRAGLNGWIEQTSLIAACFAGVQLFASVRRRGLLPAALAALAGTLAVKGLWQVGFEIPARIADFEMYRGERLGHFGWDAGTPQARLIASRMRDPAPFGYFGLANAFASLLIVTTFCAAGLAADKLAAALRSRRATKSQRERGELHLPTLAAVIACVVSLAAAVVLVLTRSVGGVGAACVGVAAGAVAWRGRRRIAPRWRTAAVAVVLVCAAAGGAVVAYGAAADSLPSRTLLVRWFYWSASGEILTDHPWLGVGPGNFPAAYLQVRRAAAEEAVKTPHNVAAHALVQYGVFGGLAYLGLLAGGLVLICRPRRNLAAPLSDSPGPLGTNARVLAASGVVAAAALLARLTIGRAADHAFLVVIDAALPALVLGGLLAAACWAGESLPAGLLAAGGRTRTALAAGCAAFVLHNMVTFSLWMGGPATVFWLALAAGLAWSGSRRRFLDQARWVLAGALAAGAVAAILLLWRPVYQRTMLTRGALGDLAGGRDRAAVDRMQEAARADALDPYAAGDAAKVMLQTAPRRSDEATLDALREAAPWAAEAIRRDPESATWRRLAAQVAFARAAPDAFRYSWRPTAHNARRAAERLEAQMSITGRFGPPSPVLAADAAAAHRALGQLDRAAELLARAVEGDRDSYFLRVRLGDVYHDLGRRREADAAWLAAARRAPSDDEAAEALEHMNRAVALDPQNHRQRVDLAEMYCDAGRPDPCQAELAAAERINEALIGESVERFTSPERARIERLHARAELLANR